jgi:hypothetical protein
LETVDNSFALENFEYVTKEIDNPILNQAYHLLGPFDFYKYKADPDDGDDLSSVKFTNTDTDDGPKRDMQVELLPRRSGALYRGEILDTSNRPDGLGFKIFHKKSLYEGHFKNGACHGYGRGISAKGEVYQGMFNQD